MWKLIKDIYYHPLNEHKKFNAVWRFFWWQLRSRIVKRPILVPFTDKSSFYCVNGFTGLTGNIYFGLMEMEEMSFLLHYMRDEDSFFDIGANGGAFSILALQHTLAEVHAFEPHPQTFELLEKNIAFQSRKNNVYLYNLALGDKIGHVNFTTEFDTENHIATGDEANVISVQMTTLNELNLTVPTIIKIDVEGFEWNVLQGASKVFESEKLMAVIIELNRSGLRYGFNDHDIDDFLRKRGLIPCSYDPFNRNIKELKKDKVQNAIYLRNIEESIKRVKGAPVFKLSNGKQL
jgi:FkbM family methyltransferase